LPEELGSADFDASNPRWAEYDRVTWPAWLASRGASKGAIDLMMLGGDSSQFSALFLLQQIMLHRSQKCVSQDRGRHGPLALGNRGHVERRHPLWLRAGAARTGAGGIRALCREKDRMTAIAADRVLIAIPFSTLRRVAIDPPFHRKNRGNRRSALSRGDAVPVADAFPGFGRRRGFREALGPTDRPTSGIPALARRAGAAFLPTQREIRRSKRTWRPCLGRTGPGLASR